MIKALFSLWNKPGSDLGFNNQKDLQASFMLAVLKANQWYEVHVVCDEYSKEWIDKLHLPIKSIQVVDFDAYNVNLWNLSKLIACTMVEPPFIHVDNDVFLHKPLPEFKDYLFQNYEHFEMNTYGFYNFYSKAYTYVKTFNKELMPLFTNCSENLGVNCGIIGIKHKRLVEEWIDQVMMSLSYPEIKDKINNKPSDEFLEIIFEQLFAVASAKYYYRDIKVLLHDMRDASKLGYTHLVAQTKRHDETIQKVYSHLEKNYLSYYKLLSHE